MDRLALLRHDEGLSASVFNVHLEEFSFFIAQFQLSLLDYKLDVARLPFIIRELAAYHLHLVLS